MLYRDYFDIDPEYFPQVNESVIEQNPDIWKKFYPHETFVKLIKSTISVLSRKQKVSIWVEGAYGTGKSHAVLTLKKLLEASPEETKTYFEKYHEQLSNDLYNQLQQLKMGDQKILTVHRYGTSTIRKDENLAFAIQESIETALEKNGMDRSIPALKDSVVKWLSDSVNKRIFNELLNGPYRENFGGDNANDIVEKLKTYAGDSLVHLMGMISTIAEERQMGMFQIDADVLIEWIKAVIQKNNLKAIVFIWDEFTEYFRNNMHKLTGFQKIVDLSATSPFYMLIVTHDALHIFPDGDKDFAKIRGRFISPICEISLPDNMAFRLMGAAMTKKNDSHLISDWEDILEDLCDRTSECRRLIMRSTNITDKELCDILPLHPYTALLLKHISSTFDSNQRSMFDFIKNDRGDEIKGFQWFMDNTDPTDDNPLLTVDELWDFFYEKGKDFLSHNIRSILDYYNYVEPAAGLGKDQRRVLKASLLMQAISQKVGSSVDLFVPNFDNINIAFEGSDLDQDFAGRIAEQLVRDKILYKQPIGGGKFQYAARNGVVDDTEIEKLIEEIKKEGIGKLIDDICSAIDLKEDLKARFCLKFAYSDNLRTIANKLRNKENELGNKIAAIATFALNDADGLKVSKTIKELIDDPSYHIVFIDASITPLGDDLFTQYAEAMANSKYQRRKDDNLADQYERDAKDVLKKWKERIENGDFIVSLHDNTDSKRITTVDCLYSELRRINRSIYKYGLETGSKVPGTMWGDLNQIKYGVEAAVAEDTTKKGIFHNTNSNIKLENFIGDAWRKENYWKDKPNLLISKIKKAVEDKIAEGFKEDGRVSIRQIYEMLTEKPFGFMPCNLSVFVFAYVLKEYVKSSYTFTDVNGNNFEPTVDNLRKMIEDVIKLQITPNPKYRDKYIATMTPEERKFSDVAASIFLFHREQCSSIEVTRGLIRNKMKNLSFPIWCLKYALDENILEADKDKLAFLIDKFSAIANNGDYSGESTDTKTALSIGKFCIENPDIADRLKGTLTSKKCQDGMDAYLHKFEGGLLIKLAERVGDHGQYINCLRKKFDADAANWVWNVETVNRKIQEVILEYQIIDESNSINSKVVDYDAAIRNWCDVCKYIRISYLYAKEYWNELNDFMRLLYNLKKQGHLYESQRQEFLNQLKIHKEQFRSYYNDQLGIFKQACEFYLTGFNDIEINDLYKEIKGDNVFTMESSVYGKLIQQTVTNFMLSRKSTKLRTLWQDKTKTVSPKKWSEKYRMPIICMVPDNEKETARRAFDVLNQNQSNYNSALVDKALEYLSQASFFTSLEDKEEREKAFKHNIIKSYEVILTDLEAVKDYLMQTEINPYNWAWNSLIDDKIRKMAKAKYDETGCEVALEKIDRMPVDDVKKYLKQLIRDNMTVGIEIIKDRN